MALKVRAIVMLLSVASASAIVTTSVKPSNSSTIFSRHANPKDANNSKVLKHFSHANGTKLFLIETGATTDDSIDPLPAVDGSIDLKDGDSDEAMSSFIDSVPQQSSTPSKFLQGAPPSVSPSENLQKLSAAMQDMQGPASASTPQSRASTMASMEASVMNLLLGKSAFGATPMGGSVKKIVNIINGEMMPKVKDAHRADQTQLRQLMDSLKNCFSVRNKAINAAKPWNVKYHKQSRLHKGCRSDEAVKYSSKESCLKQQGALYQVKVLKCRYFAQKSSQYGSTFNNKAIVTKAGSESVQSYIARVSGTVCGKHTHGDRGRKLAQGGWGGGLLGGMYDQYLKAKYACEVATREYNDKVAECKRKIHEYNVKKGKCNQFQTLMDARSCKHAVLMKDTCEQYAGCYHNKRKAFEIVRAKVRMEERDRKAEWRGLSRMYCLIDGFADGAITDKEIDACKKQTITTKFFIVDYPKIPELTDCVVSKLYPSTGAYKRREFAPLPMLAKGKVSVPCSGVEEIPTKPKEGSPKTCKCRRVTLEGHYKAGPLVKCENCHDVRRSKDKNSCPAGTKIFAPSSKTDWRTFLNSAEPLHAPHWIVDITRPQNGCGGCTSNAMNSQNRRQKTWRTSDGAPWWLRSTKYSEPSGDYSANCFLNLAPKTKPKDENSITFNDHGCNYHAKSYYCQKERIFVKPRKGSPTSCKCSPVTLSGKYSAGMLVKCEQCLKVSKSTQKNSCPVGMKIFSPRTLADWQTFIVSAQPLRAPNFIIDITRPQNGCGGCTKYAMNSKEPNQATWRTSDGSAWWLRSTRYSQPNGPEEYPNGRAHPNGDYQANCFMDLWRPPSNENTVQFNDQKCNYRSRSYYCQPVKAKAKPPAPPPPPPPRRLVPWSQLRTGLKEEAYYFTQGSQIPVLKGRPFGPNMFKSNPVVNYKDTKGKWKDYGVSENFAVRWTGYLIIPKHGKYSFKLRSDDGSKLYIDNKVIVSNDGVHTMQGQTGSYKLVRGQHRLVIEYFQKVGNHGISLQWNLVGDRLGKTFRTVPKKYLRYKPENGFKEEVYYIKGLSKVPNLNRQAANQRVVKYVNYPESKGAWRGFKNADDFACRWTGWLTITKKGTYRFSLTSDDGSRMFLNKKLAVNNDGLHGFRQKESTINARSGRYLVILEYFATTGNSGILFRYMGPDTDDKMVFVGRNSAVKVYYSTVRTPGETKLKAGLPKSKSKEKSGSKSKGYSP